MISDDSSSELVTTNDDFVLVWLDTRTESTLQAATTLDETVRRQTQLETIISFTRVFTNVQECRIFIESSVLDKILLITCGLLGESLVPQVHELEQVEVIHVFCIDDLKYTAWASPYKKIRSVCTTANELLTALASDVSMYTKNLTLLSIFNLDMSKETSLRSLTAEEVRFMWFQLLLELLLRMPSNANARHDMRSACEKAYQGNTLELGRIDHFFQTYSADRCIHWYTKDCFVYKLLNKAFRTENIDQIFKFRFFIVDLFRQLKQLHRPFTGTLWRGQTLSSTELQRLRNNVGNLVSINTFFSTTRSSDSAVSFSQEGNVLPPLESVLFQIEVNEKISDTPAFADISALSSMSQEEEILFTMNTVFRLVAVESLDTLSVVSLVLTDASEQRLKGLLGQLQKEMDEENIPPLLMLGEFLWKMGDFDRANRYYKIMLRELPSDHELIGKVNNNIGLIAFEKGDFPLAIQFFNEALRLQEPTETLDLAETYSNVALLHDTEESTDQALELNLKALHIRLRLLPHDHQLVALTYNNIGLVYFHRHEFDKSLQYYEKAREIEHSTLGSVDHFDYATTLSNIGLVHFEKGCYELALNFYQQALTIRERSLPAQHVQFSETYNNIGTVQEKLGDLHSALEMFEKALEVRLVALLPDHPSIAHSYNNLANVLDSLNRPQEALRNYMEALKHSDGISMADRRSKAKYLNNIGEYFRNQRDFVQADEYHQQALRLRLQLFPDHKDMDLAQSYSNIGTLLYEQKMYDRAFSFHSQSLTIHREILEPDHPELGTCLFNIGLVYSKQNQLETALDYFRDALKIANQALPTSHQTIISIQEMIKHVTEKSMEN